MNADQCVVAACALAACLLYAGLNPTRLPGRLGLTRNGGIFVVWDCGQWRQGYLCRPTRPGVACGRDVLAPSRDAWVGRRCPGGRLPQPRAITTRFVMMAHPFCKMTVGRLATGCRRKGQTDG